MQNGDLFSGNVSFNVIGGPEGQRQIVYFTFRLEEIGTTKKRWEKTIPIISMQLILFIIFYNNKIYKRYFFKICLRCI